MALRRTVTPECDICHRTDGVRRYRIDYLDFNPRRLTAYLCTTHRKPLERIAEKVTPKGGRRAGPAKREVLTEKQIADRRRRQARKRNGNGD